MILYSEGYRFDFKTRRFLQTGAFYFKARPADAEVYIDGKFSKKLSWFGSAFIENFLPRNYEVEIRKENYYPWKKNLGIKERLVTEAKNVVLIPVNPELEILTQDIENFWAAPDESNLILETVQNDGWALKVLDLETGNQRFLLTDANLAPQHSTSTIARNITLENVKWGPDSSRILLETTAGGEKKYFTAGLDGDNPIIALNFLGAQSREITLSPGPSSKVFFIDAGRLLEADFQKQGAGTEILPDVLAYMSWGNDIVGLNKEGILSRSDLQGRTLEIYNTQLLEIKTGAQYKIAMMGPQKIFIQEDHTLFYLDPESRTFERIADAVTNMAFSPTLRKISFYTDYEIWLYFLESEPGQPERYAKEKLFFTRFAEPIKNLFWLTDHYLIFNVGDRIKISEIDDRDRINMLDWSELKNPTVFLRGITKRLYILSNKNLYFSRELVP